IRCTMCFDMRFVRTALYAHEHGFPVISSSLGISRWKDMNQINDCGHRAAAHYPGIQYWDYNWRKGGGAARMVEISKRGDVGKFSGYYYTFSMEAQIVTPILSGWLLQNVGYYTLLPYAAIMVALSFVTITLTKHGDNRPEPPKSRLEAFDVGDD
ncbi:MAG: epoxyqueuosine reductase QueH, partial [Clostridia bacterium]